MILTDDDLKRLDDLREEVSRLELTDDDLRRLADLEREISELNLQ